MLKFLGYMNSVSVVSILDEYHSQANFLLLPMEDEKRRQAIQVLDLMHGMIKAKLSSPLSESRTHTCPKCSAISNCFIGEDMKHCCMRCNHVWS